MAEAIKDNLADALHLADGLDPSWLYDAPFDRLRGATVWCTGSRALDLATRLHYDDVDARVVSPSEIPSRVQSTEPIDIIANYTTFAEWLEVTTPC